MPVTPTYPGVYLEEIPSQTHSVVAAPTSNAAVIDFFLQGPVNVATQITSLNQFNTVFGGVCEQSEGSYAVQQFFLNGGGLIWVVRVVPESATAAAALLPATSPPSSSTYFVQALNPGAWGISLYVSLTQQASSISPPPPPAYTFQIATLTAPPNPQYIVLETYYNASLTPTSSSFLANLVNGVSQYVTIQSSQQSSPPSGGNTVSITNPSSSPPGPFWTQLTNGSNGAWDPVDGSDFLAALMAQLGGEQTVYDPPPTPALNLIAPQVFNILLLPATAILPSGQELTDLVQQAMQYCQDNQAFFLLDPPPPQTILNNQAQTLPYPWLSPSSVSFVNGIITPSQTSPNSLLGWAQTYMSANSYSAATYYPWLLIGDAANPTQARYAGPSGTVAGLYAANDASYGVWKAPAGVNSVLQGATLTTILTDTDSGNMNPYGLNALRSFPIYGNLIWGARTLAGANLLQSNFMYINVRRLTDFIEQSLTQSLKWAVFEPNASALWSSITLEVTAFLASLFSQGAFQGTTASQAYFVQCDTTTTTLQDMLNGIVNVVVGFAPVLPAEFVILQIELQLQASSAS